MAHFGSTSLWDTNFRLYAPPFFELFCSTKTLKNINLFYIFREHVFPVKFNLRHNFLTGRGNLKKKKIIIIFI